MVECGTLEVAGDNGTDPGNGNGDSDGTDSRKLLLIGAVGVGAFIAFRNQK